jgi:hypothetical protein
MLLSYQSLLSNAHPRPCLGGTDYAQMVPRRISQELTGYKKTHFDEVG